MKRSIRQRVFSAYRRLTFASLNIVSLRRLRNYFAYPRFGSHYGGWHLPKEFVADAAPKNAISAGVGEDMSFDLALASCHWHIILVDPTPRAVAHYQRVLETPPDEVRDYDYVESRGREIVTSENFEFLSKALSRETGNLRLYFPKNSSYVSLTSVENTESHRHDEYLDVEAIKIADILARCNLDEINLLKMDIEGSEVGVLESLEGSEIRPQIILVEFDCLRYLNTIREFNGMLRSLHSLIDRLGYRIAVVHDYNFTLERLG